MIFFPLKVQLFMLFTRFQSHVFSTINPYISYKVIYGAAKLKSIFCHSYVPAAPSLRPSLRPTAIPCHSLSRTLVLSVPLGMSRIRQREKSRTELLTKRFR